MSEAEPRQNQELHEIAGREYEYGFVTDVEIRDHPGEGSVSEDVVRTDLEPKRKSPSGCSNGASRPYAALAQQMLAEDTEPTWAQGRLPEDRLPGHAIYYAAPKPKKPSSRASTRSIPSCSRPTTSSASRSTSRSGLSGVAVDAVFDSVSVATTFKDELAEAGRHLLLVLRSGEDHPELVKKYLGSVVPYSDNFYACAELGGLLRRLLRLHPQGRALPHGAVDLLPHQRRGTPVSSSAP